MTQTFPNPGLEWIQLALQTYTGLTPDEHGKETPKRFIAMLSEMTACRMSVRTGDHLEKCLKWKVFDNTDGTDEMIVQTNIPFVSVCNHHVLPFSGKAHVAYIPDKKICGLSKLGRVVQHFARQLQIQERMTREIADLLRAELVPLGVAVMVQAEHMCMTVRGVQLPGTLTTTSDMRGVFADHSRTAKAEFLQIVGSAK